MKNDNEKVVDVLEKSTVVENSISNVEDMKTSLDKIGMGGVLSDSISALETLKNNKDKFIEGSK